MFVLKTEKLVQKGQKMRKILGWEGAMEENILPVGYVVSVYSNPKEPWFYKERDRIIYCIPNFPENELRNRLSSGKSYFYPNNNFSCYINVGDVFLEEDFQFLLKIFRKAGNRLHELRQKEKKLRDEWYGEESFII